MFNHLFDAKMGITTKKATNGEITKLRKDCTTKTNAHFDFVSTFGYKPPGRAKLAVTGKAMEAAGRSLDKAIRQK